MASATDEKDEKAMTTADADGPGDEEREEKQRQEHPKEAPSQGFFHIYKSGQGYWTRMGTAMGAGLLAALTANFLYQNLPIWLQGAHVAPSRAKIVAIYMIAGLMALFTLFVFWIMNKPSNADFLIATDSEMKKVNWTSRKELIGSTKVVIIFMFIIAFLLFAFDIIFGYLFYFIGVLKSKPF
jgi:preprotein translocase subunit SecE